MELLLPMAAKKLDLSFNIEPNVPPCMVFALTIKVTFNISRGIRRLRTDPSR